MLSSITEISPRVRAARRGPLATAAFLSLALGVAMMPAISHAEEVAPMSADASDPGKLGWMIGAPPPDDKIIRFSDPIISASPSCAGPLAISAS
jgi:hypothetical protein